MLLGFIYAFLAFYGVNTYWKTPGTKSISLVDVIVKNQIIYNLLCVKIWLTFWDFHSRQSVFRVLFCFLVNLIWLVAGFTKYSVTMTIIKGLGSPSFMCLFGSRMFLDLKEAANPIVNTNTISDPIFVDFQDPDSVSGKHIYEALICDALTADFLRRWWISCIIRCYGEDDFPHISPCVSFITYIITQRSSRIEIFLVAQSTPGVKLKILIFFQIKCLKYIIVRGLLLGRKLLVNSKSSM